MDKQKDVKALTKLALMVGLVLDFIEEIELNKWWFQKLKNIGLKFKKELEKHDNVMISGADTETSQNFIDGYQAISNLIDFNLSLSENQMKYFNDDLEKLIKKYE